MRISISIMAAPLARAAAAVALLAWILCCAPGSLLLAAAPARRGPRLSPTTARRTAGGLARQAAADSLLAAALVAAEKTVIPRMRREDNLTWMSMQLAELTRLLARAGRYDEALRLIESLDAPDRVKAPALAPIALAALRAGDRSRVRALAGRLAALDEWTAPAALAEIAVALHDAGNRAAALGLAAKLRDPQVRAETFRHMAELDKALAAARDVGPQSMHIPSDEGSFWEQDYGQRRALLLRLVAAYVDRGDLRGATPANSPLPIPTSASPIHRADEPASFEPGESGDADGGAKGPAGPIAGYSSHHSIALRIALTTGETTAVSSLETVSWHPAIPW
jgi:hypothetical protein